MKYWLTHSQSPFVLCIYFPERCIKHQSVIYFSLRKNSQEFVSKLSWSIETGDYFQQWILFTYTIDAFFVEYSLFVIAVVCCFLKGNLILLWRDKADVETGTYDNRENQKKDHILFCYVYIIYGSLTGCTIITHNSTNKAGKALRDAALLLLMKSIIQKNVFVRRLLCYAICLAPVPAFCFREILLKY